MKIITGADSRFFASMIQLINSIHIHEKGKYEIVAYDLGLTEQQRIYFKRDFAEVELKYFDFKKYPKHYNLKINAGAYAWKPEIINKEFTAISNEEFVFWLDAGCIIRRQLLIIRAALYFYGFYSILSGGEIKNLTHSNTIKLMNLQANSNLKMLSGGVIGFKKGTEKNKDLIQKWSEAAECPEIICPEGSSGENHRFDQSVISLLFYKIYETHKQPVISRKGLEILTHKNIWI